MEVADPATGTSYNWSLCVCGDVKKIFGVLVEKVFILYFTCRDFRVTVDDHCTGAEECHRTQI